ncbi:MAG: RNA pseudouridine synthase, partial [Pseudomonadota bacterium]
GLILLARSKRAQRILSGQFAKRIVRKTYRAEVWGAPERETGEIDMPLRADWPNRPRQMVCRDAGRPALTRWEVEERRGATTVLTLRPVTGRSHQLRVHLAAMGWPILGDPFYATGEALAAAPRLALRAVSLEWRCPGDGAWRRVDAGP